MDAEKARMDARDAGTANWAKWGPYLSERQWGTVREDYSADGDAWTYFPHDSARSRAYRWGEDGLLGISDHEGRVCFAPAFWNGRDAILKERLFGLGNPEGNHGEDVKEAYFYVDNTPTHSWMQALYKYPQAEFPYERLRAESARRTRAEPEFELADIGIFDESRYFDIFVEYAKAAPDDLAIRLRVVNRGPDPAPLTVLPTLWFRNTWSWDLDAPPAPELRADGPHAIRGRLENGSEFSLACNGAEEWLFTGNDTNAEKLFGAKNATPYVKDAFHRCIVEGDRAAVNPAGQGTKVAAVLHRTLAPGEEWSIQLRLTEGAEARATSGKEFDRIFADRRAEADAFYAGFAPDASAEWVMIKRQALAGLLWTKQFYFLNVLRWRKGDPTQPKPPPHRAEDRNAFWDTLYAFDIISMPDKWEYPYFCAWDLDFQSVAFAPFDPAFAKNQFHLLRREDYISASSQTPAYEWNFSDSNPPIGAWAAWRIYTIDRARRPNGEGDIPFLKEAFYRLLLAYGWWANRVDASGDNIFAGGFLGLDNIGAFDRRYPLPDGSVVEQSDGTSWMAAYSLNMLRIALELAQHDATYVPAADKFLVDFIHLAWVANTVGPNGISLWDHEDGFYYDVLRRSDGSSEFLKLRSLVGITPLLAVEAIEENLTSDFLQRRLDWISTHRPQFFAAIGHLDFTWAKGRKLLSLVPEDRLRRIFKRLFDENEFLSPHGIRSLSRVYADRPYRFDEGSEHSLIPYSPADSPVAMFGGNSNWRGPVWMPMNFLLIESLQKFHFYFGDDFTVEYPTGSGQHLSLWDISLDLQRRLIGLFCADADGRRPCFGDDPRFAADPHWQGLVQFFEYFHGDTGRGLGASHQTGWTALVAKMVQQTSTFAARDGSSGFL